MSKSSDKVRQILGSLIAAENAGEIISHDRVLARHPELATELPAALEFLSTIRATEAECAAAGAIHQPLELYSDDELNAAIDCDNIHDEHAESDVKPAVEWITGYQMLEQIGQGGQATVYRARKLSTGGIVAIKVLPGGFFATSRARMRFDREAVAMVRISHPNVIPVLDKGRTRDGSPFIAMEYIEGLPVDRFLAGGDDVVRIAKIFRGIASAVQELHRCDILHRDLKPSNVLVDRYGQPHVLDFGLVQIAGQPGVTDTGQVLGSIPWASPEQAAGRLEDVGEHSDIYSIGVMLAFILDGKFPYPTFGSSMATARHICNTPPRLGQGRVKTSLDSVALKCLAKRPKDRYASAAELAKDFERIEAGLPPAIAAPRGISRRMLWALVPVICLTSLLSLATHVGNGDGTDQHASSPPGEPGALIELPSKVNFIGMRFVGIPAGTFMMGSPIEEPGRSRNEQRKPVRIASQFFLAVTETTQAAYERVMKTNPSDPRFRGANFPVQCVSYQNAEKFCAELGKLDGRKYRLPTEAEWEYACRASADYTTTSLGNLSKTSWWLNNSQGKLHATQTLRPNHWELHDMLGNVAEWCAAPATSDPVFEETGTRLGITKGGSFESTSTDCRCAGHRLVDRDIRTPTLGFRVILER